MLHMGIEFVSDQKCHSHRCLYFCLSYPVHKSQEIYVCFDFLYNLFLKNFSFYEEFSKILL